MTDGRTVLLGADLGFASVGWSVVVVARGNMPGNSVRERVLDLGVIRTAPDKAKHGVYASDDTLRRGVEIARALSAVIEDRRWHAVDVVCVESMSWPRNAGVVAKLGVCWGVVAAVCDMRRIPIVQVSPQRMRANIGLAKNASKDDVHDVVVRHFGGRAGVVPDLASGLGAQKVHALDALAAVVACLDSDVVRAAARPR